MGVGSYGLADTVNLTADSEYDPRARAITTEQIHHTAWANDAGCRALMDPGGRTVSANYLLLMDGRLMEVVPLGMRAYTSASGFDHESVTIEVVNQTNGPEWGISEKQRQRLATLARDLRALGLIRHLNRGVGGILGHFEVPGTYATSCPGPDMHLDHISWLANNPGSWAGGEVIPIGDDEMSLIADGAGVLHFADEYGTEPLATYVSPDMDNGTVVAATNKAFGNYAQLSQWEFDVVTALVARRNAAIRAAELAAFAQAIRPDIDAADLETALRAVVGDGLDFELDPDAERRLAEVVNDERDAREKLRLNVVDDA